MCVFVSRRYVMVILFNGVIFLLKMMLHVMILCSDVLRRLLMKRVDMSVLLCNLCHVLVKILFITILMVFGLMMTFMLLLIVLCFLVLLSTLFVIVLFGFLSTMVMLVLIFILIIRLRSMLLKLVDLFVVVRHSRPIGLLT